MSYAAIKIGSVTRAVMLKNILEKHNIKSTAIRTPPEMNKGACSYSLKIDFLDIEPAKKICADNNIRIKGIYTEKGGEYYDIS